MKRRCILTADNAKLTTEAVAADAANGRPRFIRGPRIVFAMAVLMWIGISDAYADDEYWRTDGTTGGTWTSTFWNIGSPNATGGTGC